MTENDDRLAGKPPSPADELLEWAWTIICNVSRGNWRRQPDEWQAAAEKFRDQYDAHLSESKARSEA